MHSFFTMKRVLKIAVLTTVGLTSCMSFAQTSDYRRGYDQGYRDGLESQSHMDHRGGPEGRIIVEEARYGARDAGFCSPRDAIQGMIGWRRHADIRASNELCGDPARGLSKHLEVRYRCGDGPSTRAEAPEGGFIMISCE